MKKIALLFGINYKGTNSELNGCINDVNAMAEKLVTDFKYTEIRLFTDDTVEKPTKQKMIFELEKIITDSVGCEEIFIHYSGHGGNIKDMNKEESDGYDEVIFPIDFRTNGFIKDDVLHSIIIKTKCDLRILLDCCNSGTGTDLYYNVRVKNDQIAKTTQLQKPVNNQFNILMLSGCLDEQVSYDVYDRDRKKYMGALTSTFLDIHNETKQFFAKAAIGIKTRFTGEPKIQIMLLELTKRLREKGYKQIPVLSANKNINLAGIFLSYKNLYKPSEITSAPVILSNGQQIQTNPIKTGSGGCTIQ